MTNAAPFVAVAATAALLGAVSVSAQSVAVVPPIAATLPGNAAVSMPLRWSQGSMQVRIDAALLPPALAGRTLTGLRLRKPSALFEPAYAPVTRTLTIRGGFHAGTAAQASPTRTGNVPAGTVVLFGPAPVTSLATAATGSATAVGERMLEVTFTTPLPVTAGNLFLEFETTGASFVVGAEDWVDAVWVENGAERGYAVPVGDGSCTTRSVDTELAWVGSGGPRVGQTATMRVTGAPPTVPNTAQVGFVMAWFGVDPIPRGITSSYVGYGGNLGALSAGLNGCHQWAPIDVSWGGLTDLAGSFALNLNLAQGATAGMKLGVQAAWLDVSRPGLPLSVSNGMMLVLDTIAVGNLCSTVFFPAGVTTTPWPINYGLMPVVSLLY